MNDIFVWIRVLHLLMSALWIGSTAMAAFFLLPAMRLAGADGAKVASGLGRVGFHAFMGAIGGLTVLTGIYLFWHFTAGFDPAISRSTGGMFFSIGGALGLIAVILGGSVVGRTAKKLGATADRLATASGAERQALDAQVAALSQKMSSSSKLVVLLLVATLVLMGLGHYV